MNTFVTPRHDEDRRNITAIYSISATKHGRWRKIPVAKLTVIVGEGTKSRELREHRIKHSCIQIRCMCCAKICITCNLCVINELMSR